MLPRKGVATKGCFPGQRDRARSAACSPGASRRESRAVGQCRAVDKHNEHGRFAVRGRRRWRRRRPLPPRWRRRPHPGISTNCVAAYRHRPARRRRRRVRLRRMHCRPDPGSRSSRHLGRDGFDDLNRRTVNLQRQVRDNGVTLQRVRGRRRPAAALVAGPVPADHLTASWQQIETGVLQRVKLLDRIMADVYGPQQLLAAQPAAARPGPRPSGLPASHARRASPPAARTCTSPLSTWRATPPAPGGSCRSAPRRLRAWATCWKTG